MRVLVAEAQGAKINLYCSLYLVIAWTLLRETYPVKKGDWILVHAAAGGVGLLLCQMAAHLGAHVIGTTSSEEKAELAKKNGAKHMINYVKENTVEKVLELTDGLGVQGIFDGVGKDTWEGAWADGAPLLSSALTNPVLALQTTSK